MAHQTLYTLTDISPLASIKLTTLYPHFSQTYAPSSPLQSQKYPKLPSPGSQHPPSQHPPPLFSSNKQHPPHSGIHLQHLLNLQPNPTPPSYSIPFPASTSPPNSPNSGNFTPHLHHHHTWYRQTKLANPNGSIISSLYSLGLPYYHSFIERTLHLSSKMLIL